MKILFVVMLAAAGLASAAFVKQPYLQNLTDSSIVVRWETSDSSPAVVQFGLSPYYGQEVVYSISALDHELTLPGLGSDTVYHYRAISRGDTSADATFHMPVSPQKPFRFIAYGDDRSDSAAHQSVVDRMSVVDPAPGFLLSVGDLTADGSVAHYQTLFNIERGVLNRVALFPVVGNHDLGSLANWLRFLALPGNERWYTVRYGNSAFHSVDNYSTYTPGSEQYNWLVSELQRDSANPAVRHIFVFLHEPPYTTNLGHSSNLTVRQHLCPLFERFHVGIVFNGHVHCYEHSLVNDVHYVTTGGGGAPLYNNWGPPQSWTVYREATYEFALLDVRGDLVCCRAITPGGAVVDSFALIAGAVGESAPDSMPMVRPTLLMSVQPNPVTGQAWIRFTLTRNMRVTLAIFDALGNEVADLVERRMDSGSHSVVWDSRGLPDGLYFCSLTTPDGGTTVPLLVSR